jgi:hypothetical protein
VEAAARQKAEEQARRFSVDRARLEVAEADAKKAAAVAAEAEEEGVEARRVAREDELAAARESKRERWASRGRRVGNVAASIGIVGLAVFGADRIFQIPDASTRAPSAVVRTVPAAQPAVVTPPAGQPADPVDSEAVDGGSEPEDTGEGVAPLVVLPPDFEIGVPGVENPEVVPAGIDPRIYRLDVLADSADGAMVYFRSLAAAFGAGTKGCDDLKAAYVDLDSRWVAYVVGGYSRMEAALDDERTARHASLRRDKQRSELTYEVTGCPIP